MRTAKILIRLGGCPGWSESSLGTHSFCWFCHVAAQMQIQKLENWQITTSWKSVGALESPPVVVGLRMQGALQSSTSHDQLTNLDEKKKSWKHIGFNQLLLEFRSHDTWTYPKSKEEHRGERGRIKVEISKGDGPYSLGLGEIHGLAVRCFRQSCQNLREGFDTGSRLTSGKT